MAADDPILIGTISIANGADLATVDDAALADVVPYDMVVIDGVPGFVEEVVSGTQLRVWANWTETSAVDAPFQLYKISPYRQNAGGIFSRQRLLLELMERRWFVEQFDAVPANSYGQNGQWALVTSDAESNWYLRLAGVWVLQGPFLLGAPAVHAAATGSIPLSKFDNGVRSHATILQMALDESHASWIADGEKIGSFGKKIEITWKEGGWLIAEPVIARDGFNLEGAGGTLVRAMAGLTIHGMIQSEGWYLGNKVLKCYRHHNLVCRDLDNMRPGSFLTIKGDRFDIKNYQFRKLASGWANHMLGDYGSVDGWHPDTYDATIWVGDPNNPAQVFSDGFHGSYMNFCSFANINGRCQDDIFAITFDPIIWETMTMPGGRRKSFDGNTLVNVRGRSKNAHVLRIGTEPGNGTVDPNAWIGENLYIGVGASPENDGAERIAAVLTFDDRRDNAARPNGHQNIVGLSGRVASVFIDNTPPTGDVIGAGHVSIYGHGANTALRNWDKISGANWTADLIDGAGGAVALSINGVRKLRIAHSDINVGTLTQPTRIEGSIITNVDDIDLSDVAIKGYSTTAVLGIHNFKSLRTHNLSLKGSPTPVGATVTMTVASPCVVTDTAHGLLPGTQVVFTNVGGTLPTGIVGGTTYYVALAGLTANTYQVAATLDGASINTTGSSTGTTTRSLGDEFYGFLLEPAADAVFEQSGFLKIADTARGIAIVGSNAFSRINWLGELIQENVSFPALPTGTGKDFVKAVFGGKVFFDRAQTLSAGEKTQAMVNIGVSAVDTGGRLAPLGQPNISDMHTFPGSGFFTTTSNPTNGPGAGFWGGIFEQYSANSGVWEVCQIGIAVPVFYRKECYSGTWGSWEQCRFTLSQALARFARFDAAQSLSGANKTQFLTNVGAAPSGWNMARANLAVASGLTTAGVVNPTSLEVIGTDFTVGSDKITANVACRVRIIAQQYYWSISGGTVNFGIRKNGSTYLDLDGSSFARRLVCDSGDVALAVNDYVQVVTAIGAGTPTWSAVGPGSSIFTVQRSY